MTIPFEEVKLEDYLLSDGSLTCTQAGEVYSVFQDPNNTELCIRCSVGRHYLTKDDHGLLVGFSKVDKPEPRKTQF